MDSLKIERVGGLAGFGLPGSHLKSRGSLALSALSPTDQQAVEALFQPGATRATPPTPDGFRYRLTRQTSKGPVTVEVSEDRVPLSIRDCLHDSLE